MRIRFLKPTTIVAEYSVGEEAHVVDHVARELLSTGAAVLALDDVARLETAVDTDVETAVEHRERGR